MAERTPGTRVTDQVVLEFRIGPGEQNGKRGEHLFAQTIDARQAHVWRGIVGQGVPGWTGGLFIYADDQMISALPARDSNIPERAPSAEEVQSTRNELARLQSHQIALHQQLEVDTLRLQAAQEELVRTQQLLADSRERYAREMAEIDGGLSLVRTEAAKEREAIYTDMTRLRREAGEARSDVLLGIRDTQGILASFRQHISELALAEMEQGRFIQRRKMQAEAHLSKDIAGLEELMKKAAANDGQSGVDAFFTQLQNFITPDVLMALLQKFGAGAAGQGGHGG